MPRLPQFIAPALASILAGGFTLGAMPAQAASYDRNGPPARYGDSHRAADRYAASRSALVRADIDNLRRDIDRAAARRIISQREAAGLRRDAAEIQRLHASYARGGLDSRELQTLQRKVDRIRVALQREARDRDGKRR